MAGLLRGLQRELAQHWLRWTLIAWLALVAWFIWQRWPWIYWFALGDTDDNMRIMQVRGLLAGQGWYDLTQYRLNPPNGFNIHWSRIVDLPIAGLILFFRLFTTNDWAERLAVGFAPLLPLSVVMASLAFAVRRLVSPLAWPLAITLMLLGCGVALLMFMPERIDHHGWQLALLTLTVAGLADHRAGRGAAIIGASSAVSLNIGLEMLPYCAMAGAILALRWVWDAGDARRLKIYALTLGGGSALGFAIFASNANHAMRCDALTPVWLSVMVVAGALLFALATWNPGSRVARLGAAILAGAIIVAGFALMFPQCLGRPEGVSPELQRIWLDNVREAKPIYEHPLRNAIPIATLPLIGLIGTIFASWAAWRRGAFMAWLPVALFTIFACLMLLWQVRGGPAAQLLAVPGVTALVWMTVPWLWKSRSPLVRATGGVVVLVAICGLFAGYAVRWFAIDPPSKRVKSVNRANSRCATITHMRTLNRFPAQTVFTHVDLGPRMIATTHMNAIAGPYHRNGDAILDVHHAFMGTPEQFRQIARRHGATLLITCPNMSETTVYRARSPGGFYDQLAHNKVPGFLTPVKMPEKSPYRVWRIN